MEDFRVRVSIRNNQLITARELLGFTQCQVAKAIGISPKLVSAFETLQASPLTAKGEWKRTALHLAAFYCVEPENLFTAAHVEVRRHFVERPMSAEDIQAILPDGRLRLTETRQGLERMLKMLAPREEHALTMRYGLDGDEPKTLEEIGDFLGRGPEGARQIIRKAMKKLRHPSRLRLLSEAEGRHYDDPKPRS